MQSWPFVHKSSLKNGMTVLVIPQRNIPKVSIQLWYNVGSKDEQIGEKGIAHLIEHMIFKGTEKLSESDINLITHKLSGVCNAFTSYDYTGYLFDLPAQNWAACLPIMADCMTSCTFKQAFLNSELKAVIQELKMYRDDYVSTLLEKMVSAIFPDHPYHHPIIGYKQDLWSLQRDKLLNFYKKHYVPNNATLVVVGDVDPVEALAEARAHFESLAPDYSYKKEEFYHSRDLAAQGITLYRDVQNPTVIFSWVVPGLRDQKEYILDTLSWIIGAGKGSRLYKKLVDELKIATELDCFVYDLFDASLFCIQVQPVSERDLPAIRDIVVEVIITLRTHGVEQAELDRATKKIAVDFLALYENTQQLAYLTGKYYLGTGRSDYLAEYGNGAPVNLAEQVMQLVCDYMLPELMHTGTLRALAPQAISYWQGVQELSDQEDSRILGNITRETAVEDGSHVHGVVANPRPSFSFPRATHFTLSNGLRVFSYNQPIVPKIECIVDMHTKFYVEPGEKSGLTLFMSEMLQEGTKKHSGEQIATILESNGMSLNSSPGQLALSMLSADAAQGFDLLREILAESLFPEEAIEKIRTRLLTDLEIFWDTPTQCIAQLAREAVYGDHPYAKNVMGTVESIAHITRKDLIEACATMMTPHKSRLSMVGDLSALDVQTVLEHALAEWAGSEPAEIVFPEIKPIRAHTVDRIVNRDQIVLAYAGLSVSRFDPDFDKLLLFDQIFTGGVLGSMSSRLFDLRERSGLFYTIGGSLIARVDEQPGMVFVRTIVSPDRLAQAEYEIEGLINEGARDLVEAELDEARNAILNSLVDHCASQKQLAGSFLFLDQFNFAPDFFERRAEQLAAITIDDVQRAVSKVLDTNKLVKIRIGRLP